MNTRLLIINSNHQSLSLSLQLMNTKRGQKAWMAPLLQSQKKPKWEEMLDGALSSLILVEGVPALCRGLDLDDL